MANIHSTLNGLDLTTLRLFVAAVEEGNLGRAAEREHISLSALSRRIADMESRLGVLLLLRHDRGVTPTAAAIEMLPRLRDVLELLKLIAANVMEHAEGIRGVVRVQAHLTALAGRLPMR